MLRAASIWATFLSSSAHTLADDSPMQKVQSASASPDGAREDAPENASVEQLAAIAYQQALADYANGNVSTALDRMRESYRLSKRPELLYNLAQLEEELKACPEALTDYRRYLELVPTGRYRESASQAQGRLESVCPSTAPAPAPETAPLATTSVPPPSPGKLPIEEPDPDGYWTTSRVVGWSAIAAGTLVGASALYFQLEAVQARDEFQQSVDLWAAGGPEPDMSLQSRQHRYNHLAIGLGVGAGTLVAGGAIVLLLDPRNATSRRRSANLYASPGLLGASYTQRF